MSATAILRGGSELTPADFTLGGAQSGGIMVQGGKRSGSKRSGSKRRGSKRRGSKRSKRSRRKMRGGNCGAPLGTTMGGNMSGMPQMGGMITPPSGGGGRTRRLRKLSGKARRHRTKSYSA